MRYFGGILIILLGLGVFSYMWGIFPRFLVPTTLTIMVFLLTIIGVIVATSSLKIFFRGYRALFSSKYTISSIERDKAITLFKLLSKAVVKTSTIAFVLVLFYSTTDLFYGTSFEREQTLFVVGLGFRNIIFGLLISLLFFDTAAYALLKPSKED